MMIDLIVEIDMMIDEIIFEGEIIIEIEVLEVAIDLIILGELRGDESRMKALVLNQGADDQKEQFLVYFYQTYTEP